MDILHKKAEMSFPLVLIDESEDIVKSLLNEDVWTDSKGACNFDQCPFLNKDAIK